MYFIYVTTNNVNGKKYAGLCSMKKPNWESYIGSGKILRKAISKYGSDKFTREIISYHDNLEEAIITERNFILENKCHLLDEWYNIAVGFTTQGFKGKKQTAKHAKVMKELLTGVKHSEETNAKVSATRKRKFANGEYIITPISDENRKKLAINGKRNIGRIHIKKLCVHCNKTYGPSPFARSHGEKCKSKLADHT